MQKTIYCIRAVDSIDQAHFKNVIFSELLPRLKDGPFIHIKLGITEIQLPRFTLVPFDRSCFVMISLWAEKPCEELLDDMQAYGEVWAYTVNESAPLTYDKTWGDGEASPGVVLLTALKKNPNMEQQEFMHQWHDLHSPKAMRIHPMCGYIRNVCEDKILASSPDFEGFVEEYYRDVSDIYNPVKMFGGGLIWLKNIVEIGLHVKHFLDLPNLKNYLLTEYHIR